jgi:hypothetical protein
LLGMGRREQHVEARAQAHLKDADRLGGQLADAIL